MKVYFVWFFKVSFANRKIITLLTCLSSRSIHPLLLVSRQFDKKTGEGKIGKKLGPGDIIEALAD